MSRWMFSLALATSLLATPALAATKADVKDATTHLRDERKLQRHFEAAEKKWIRGYEKDKSPVMLSAGKKLTTWVAEALEEIPRRVLQEVRDGEDDTMRTRYADALVTLRGALANNGGDGRAQADAQTHALLLRIDEDLRNRVGVREARERRIKAEYKASK